MGMRIYVWMSCATKEKKVKVKEKKKEKKREINPLPD